MANKQKPRLWDIVQIDWLDSMHVGGWLKWENVDWHGTQNSLSHKSVGYVAYMDKASVHIVQSFQDLWEDGNPKCVDAVMQIPRCAITKITVLARKNKESSG